MSPRINITWLETSNSWIFASVSPAAPRSEVPRGSTCWLPTLHPGNVAAADSGGGSSTSAGHAFLCDVANHRNFFRLRGVHAVLQEMDGVTAPMDSHQNSKFGIYHDISNDWINHDQPTPNESGGVIDQPDSHQAIPSCARTVRFILVVAQHRRGPEKHGAKGLSSRRERKTHGEFTWRFPTCQVTAVRFYQSCSPPPPRPAVLLLLVLLLLPL